MERCWMIETPWDEHWLWISILEDHATFVHDFLAVEEESWISVAGSYIEQFGSLKRQLSTLNRSLPVQTSELQAFSKAAYDVSAGYFNFEGTMQRLRLANEVNLNISPTYLNGTLNENQEYLRMLKYYTRGEEARQLQLVNLLDLWLEDQLGHALLLKSMSDPIEKQIETQAEFYVNAFRLQMAQNMAMRGYLRFMQPGFPSQRKFAREVAVSTMGLYALVEKVLKLFDRDEFLNKTTRRFLDHHMPETCYFLQKLQAFEPSIVSLPNYPKMYPVAFD